MNNPRARAEHDVHELLDRVASGSADIRGALATLTLGVLLEPSAGDNTRAFRVDYSAFLFCAAVHDPLVSWAERLRDRNPLESVQFEQAWRNFGALTYVDKEFPVEAVQMLGTHLDTIRDGPLPKCSWQQRSDAILSAYIAARAGLQRGEAEQIISALSIGWDWADSFAEIDIPLGRELSTAEKLESVVRFYLVREIFIHRLRGAALLPAIRSDRLAQMLVEAMNSAESNLTGSGWSLVKDQVPTFLLLYLHAPQAVEAKGYLLKAYRIGGANEMKNALMAIGEFLDTKHLDWTQRIRFLKNSDLAILFYWANQADKSHLIGAEISRSVVPRVTVSNIGDVKMLIESAIHFFKERGETCDVMHEFWNWLLDILSKLEGEAFLKLSSAMSAALIALKPLGLDLDEIRNKLRELVFRRAGV